MKKKLLLFSALTLPIHAATVSVTDADGSGYGNFQGLAVDFDATTGLSADWSPDLVNGQQYSVDSISVFARNATDSTDWYLGVYTQGGVNVGGAGIDLGGFLGTSSNTVDLSAANGKVTWNFTGINVTADNVAGGGSGELFFVLQSVTTAQTELGPANNTTDIRRIDGGNGSYTDELAAILHNDAEWLKTTRAPEYEATLTAIPEPSSTALLGLGGLALILRRRK